MQSSHTFHVCLTSYCRWKHPTLFAMLQHWVKSRHKHTKALQKQLTTNWGSGSGREKADPASVSRGCRLWSGMTVDGGTTPDFSQQATGSSIHASNSISLDHSTHKHRENTSTTRIWCCTAQSLTGQWAGCWIIPSNWQRSSALSTSQPLLSCTQIHCHVSNYKQWTYQA